MKYIKLTQNEKTKVCDCCYDKVANNKWYFDGHYAQRKQRLKKEKRYQSYRMHAVIMNTPKGMDTDHINGDKLDNRCSNLRICTRSQNKVSSSLNRKDNTSGYKGVCYDKSRGKYMAHISLDGSMKNLGRFDDIKDAILMRKTAEEQYLTSGMIDYSLLTGMKPNIRRTVSVK